MLLFQLTTSLHYTHQELLHTIHKTALHNKGFYVLHSRTKSTRRCFCLLKRSRQVSHLLLALPLKFNTSLSLSVYRLLVLQGTVGNRCVMSCTETPESAKMVPPVRRVKTIFKRTQLTHHIKKATYLLVCLVRVGSERNTTAELCTQLAHLVAKGVIASLYIF